MGTDVLSRDCAGVDRVGDQLAREFAGAVAADVVEQVVRTARSNLEGDVPDGALPELLHRLAKQRLVDLMVTDRKSHRSVVIDRRGGVS
jgi:hypothetical protein